jgi:hypothetical protein
LWDLTSGQKISKLSGHTNPLVSLKFAHGNTLLSAAQNDKFVACWSLPATDIPEEVLSPSGCFVNKGYASELIVSHDEDSDVTTLAVLNGAHSVLSLWKVNLSELFSGKVSKPVKPHGLVEIGDNHSIHSFMFANDGEMRLCRGSTLKPYFQRVKIVNDDNKLCNVQVDSRGVEHFALAKQSKKRSFEEAVNEEHKEEEQPITKKAKVEKPVVGSLESVHGAMLKSKMVKLAKIEESNENGKALAEIAAVHAASQAADAATVGSSVTLSLEQALQIGDKPSIDSCLKTRDKEIIRQTVERLDEKNVMELLEYIVISLDASPRRAFDLLPWLMSMVEIHALYFIKGNAKLSQSAFKTLYQMTDARLASYSKFMELEGRIGVILNHHRFLYLSKQKRHSADVTMDESNIVNANAPLTIIQE